MGTRYLTLKQNGRINVQLKSAQFKIYTCKNALKFTYIKVQFYK